MHENFCDSYKNSQDAVLKQLLQTSHRWTHQIPGSTIWTKAG